MLGLQLREQIYTFIQEFRVVEERQVRLFFSDQDIGSVLHELRRLKNERRVFELGAGMLSVVRKLPMNIGNYLENVHAVNVLCKYRSSEICWVSLTRYPANIMFQTMDNIIYDVTVFDTSNIENKGAFLHFGRSQILLDAESDPINHIAVVDDMAMLETVEKKYGFTQFAMIDRNAQVELFHIENE